MSLGVVFNIQTLCFHDGPGLRTTVFLKGCPLSCHWCANPESIHLKPELGVIRVRCNRCKKCLTACPEQAITFDTADVIQIERARCNGCGQCVEVCNPEALVVYGKEISAEQAFEKVCRDERYYRGSGGGVTASGGEPLDGSAFVLSLFQMCRERGIHTCLDTSGYADSEVLRSVLRFTNYVLFDIKHMDPEVHRKFTGHSNGLILNNAMIVAESGVPMLVRMPLVPGVNDTLDNVVETAKFVKSLGNHLSVELLPYHTLGVGKYQALDMRYLMEDIERPKDEHIEHIRKTFERLGMKCVASK